jgi:LysR family transcriptional regulator, hydrogen peroxide-inducible genes activator
MNIQQLQYILALDKHRHFVKASEACFVTQPTLSTMIHKLEEELGVVLFDRSKQPIEPTEMGRQVVAQARIILREVAYLEEMVKSESNEISGEFRLGIIPTVAPYLLPLFVRDFLQTYPKIHMVLKELNTAQIIDQLQNKSLDAAILATPLHKDFLEEYFLYNEQFLAYTSQAHRFPSSSEGIRVDQLDTRDLWLLEEGHCLRAQTLNLCKMRDNRGAIGALEYQAGSIEALKGLVNSFEGWTILPELALLGQPWEGEGHVHRFAPPIPVREIALVTYRHFSRSNLILTLQAFVQQKVGPLLSTGTENQSVLPL